MSDIPNSVIVLLVILGAGCLVLVGWAIHSNFTGRQPEGHLHGEAGPNVQTQDDYMRDVRQRHQDDLAAQYGWRR